MSKYNLIDELIEKGLELKQDNPSKAYEFAKEAMRLEPTDAIQLVDALCIIARYKEANNDFLAARQNYKKAYEYYEYIPIRSQGELSMEIGAFMNVVQENEQALYFFQQAQEKFIECDDISSTLYLLLLQSDLLEEMGDPSNAMKLLKKVIKVRESLGHHNGIVLPYIKLIDLYLIERDFEEGETAIEKVFSYLSFTPHLQSLIYISVLDFYRIFKEYDKVQFYAQQIAADGTLHTNPDILIILFQYYVETEAFEEALAAYETIKKQYILVENHSKLKFLFTTGMQLFSKLKEFEMGRNLFKEYLKIVEAGDDYNSRWLAYSMYGDFLCDFGLYKEAIQQFLISAESLEKYRLSVPLSEFDRITFFSNKIYSLDKFCKTALEHSHFAEGFLFLESSKSKSLVDLLANDKYMKVVSFELIKEQLR